MLTEKIELYRVRDFGSKVSTTFDFVRENFRVLFRLLTYLLLPVCLVQGLLMGEVMDAYTSLLTGIGGFSNQESMMLGLIFLGFFLVYMVGYSLLLALLYSLMRLYRERPQGLTGIGWAELRPQLTHALRRMVALWAVGVVAAAILGALMVLVAYVAPLAILLLYVLAMVVAVPFTLLAPIYLFEDNTRLPEAIAKTWRLGWATWGGTFALLVVLGVIAYMLQGVIAIPFVVCFGVKAYLSASDATTVSPLFSFLSYLTAVLQAYGAYLAYSLLAIGLAFQYGHASEKVDRVTMSDHIDHFDQL